MRRDEEGRGWGVSWGGRLAKGKRNVERQKRTWLTSSEDDAAWIAVMFGLTTLRGVRVAKTGVERCVRGAKAWKRIFSNVQARAVGAVSD